MPLNWQWSEEYLEMARKPAMTRNIQIEFFISNYPPLPPQLNWIVELHHTVLHRNELHRMALHCTALQNMMMVSESARSYSLSPPTHLHTIYTRTYTYTHTAAYIYIYTHTHIHIHTHMTYHVWGIELHGIYDSLLRILVKIKLDSNPKPPVV